VTQNCKSSAAFRSTKVRTIPPSRLSFAPPCRRLVAEAAVSASLLPAAAGTMAALRTLRSMLDLSVLIPQSSNLFVRLARGIRSQ
jgi:hypothetical protein